MPFFRSKLFWFAIILFVTVTIAMHYLVVYAGAAGLEKRRQRSERLASAYVELNVVDIEKVIKEIRRDLEVLQERKTNYLEQMHSEDELPRFVSELEALARRARVTTTTPIVRYKESENTGHKPVTFHFKVSGDFFKILDFLDALSKSQNPWLVEQFSLAGDSSSKPHLVGNMTLMRLIEKDSLASGENDE